MNIEVHVSLLIMHFLSVCSGVRLLDYMVILFLVFFEEPPYSTTVAAPIYIPINSIGEFFFSAYSLVFITCRHFKEGHSIKCEV